MIIVATTSHACFLSNAFSLCLNDRKLLTDDTLKKFVKIKEWSFWPFNDEVMNRAYFVSCDPSNLLVRDAMDELREQKRLIYEAGGYNEASFRGDRSIVSVDNETVWRTEPTLF